MKYEFVIGIDPGVTTGYAVWCTTEKKLIIVSSSIRCEIEDRIKSISEKSKILVRFEDARMRTWFGQSGREKLQGAGSIKRDSQLWEEWLTYYNIPFQKVAPKNNKTKISSSLFKSLTKFNNPTNEHSRDAAMLVFQYQ